MLPEAARGPDADADLQAIRRIQQGMSRDGLIPPGSLESVRDFVAVSNPAVRAAHMDLASLYTNEFASMK